MRNLNPNEVPLIDRPVSEKNLSSVGNFFGLYGGEHIAATEFVIGATLVSWGCSAKTILLGLIIGNLLAMLSFTFCCATLATSSRLTLYSYLKKILGPAAQKFYNLVWSLCSIALAGSGICVSATAIREVVGIPIQHEWYPTSITFVIIVLILGGIVTLVAANGFEACAKFASTCVPWMICVFFISAVVALPQLAQATGVEINSLSDVWAIFNANVGSGSGNPNAEPFTIFHVACFAWLCNLAWHMGCNDMGLFRFAKNYKYGYISAIGMFIGHFFAWICVAIMGAAASALLKVSLDVLDPGAVTNTVVGLTGICAVIVAGWTTANPTVYRSALSLNTLLPKLSQKQVTYIVGILMTVLACFPGMTNIGDIVRMLGWAVVGVGAMCIVEHFLFPKIGYTRFFTMYKERSVNWAAIITWAVSILFVVTMVKTGAIHSNFIFIPEYIISAVLYTVLAGFMGAKGDYSKEIAEEEKFQKELKDLVDREMEEKLKNAGPNPVLPGYVKVLSYVAYVLLAVLVVCALMTYGGSIAVPTFKTISICLTIGYFILNGTSTVIKYRSEASAIQ
ncbi:MAG: hypothetical protein Q4B03_10060 [Lachnospiraceae bacterium]|nr:hypothetical protein [Lachnospiraceae bacterium]